MPLGSFSLNAIHSYTKQRSKLDIVLRSGRILKQTQHHPTPNTPTLQDSVIAMQNKIAIDILKHNLPRGSTSEGE
jgi:hypothetical protein